MRKKPTPTSPLAFRVTADTIERWQRLARTQNMSAVKAFEYFVFQLDASVLRRLDEAERLTYEAGAMDHVGYRRMLERNARAKLAKPQPEAVS
jgi:hypothetical protein